MKKQMAVIGVFGVALGVFLLFLKLIPLLIVTVLIVTGLLLFLNHKAS